MTSTFIIGRCSLLSALALGGCVASQGALPVSSPQGMKFSTVEDAVAALKSGNEEAYTSVPRIHLNLLGSVAPTNYVDARFSVTQDAYVLIVAVDLDRRVRVVFPESPDESGYVTHNNSQRLQRFFAGFGPASNFGRYSSFYNTTERITRYGGSGFLLAIASDRPLQFERLTAGGDWDENEIARFVFEASAPTAVHALGRAVVLTGQQFNTDFSAFRDGHMGFSTFAYNSFHDCGPLSDFEYDGLGTNYHGGFGVNGSSPYAIYFTSNGVLYAQFQYTGRCGQTLYSTPVPVLPIRRDTTHKVDSVSTSTYRGRIATGTSTQRIPVSSIEATAGQPVTGFRIPRTPTNGEPTVRNAERPTADGGIRFRSPEQVMRKPDSGVETRERREFVPRERTQPPERTAPAPAPTTERTAQPRSEPARADAGSAPPRGSAAKPEPTP